MGCDGSNTWDTHVNVTLLAPMHPHPHRMASPMPNPSKGVCHQAKAKSMTKSEHTITTGPSLSVVKKIASAI